jgi:hypothetical protein
MYEFFRLPQVLHCGTLLELLFSQRVMKSNTSPIAPSVIFGALFSGGFEWLGPDPGLPSDERLGKKFVVQSLVKEGIGRGQWKTRGRWRTRSSRDG